MAQKILIIAINFGTTFSGIAWASPTNADEPEIITAWPGGGNRTSDKIPQHKAKLSKFKLLLDESQDDRRQCAQEAKALMDNLEKSAVDVSADFLRAIFRVAKQQLERRYSLEFVESSTLQAILTVPAVWSDKAKDATLKAANRAGLGKYELTMLSEPEAAALYTLRSIRPNDMMVDDAFVVCDAGGGTVDLITYRIKAVDPLELAEVVPGSGGLCGGVMLDAEFENLVKRLLGTKWDQITAKERGVIMNAWIDGIKCSFGGVDDDLDETDSSEADSCQHVRVNNRDEDDWKYTQEDKRRLAGMTPNPVFAAAALKHWDLIYREWESSADVVRSWGDPRSPQPCWRDASIGGCSVEPLESPFEPAGDTDDSDSDSDEDFGRSGDVFIDFSKFYRTV
ncbi:uncharacterized protein K452DRAFT_312172 [Aplosporella prunicola CBS 121167]|uniref:Ppx/GppA phosphatase domain-containing protein n=1 Tax=Aplosporella prunicola CBS 121167 TaxID=1176127 RepID=A0A6A6B4X2_9PEZI|nr:uncharacterized protein K452DRAFT_312172 [Aplosporella prunicola CBS 121167]KAF2137801.1 hypothetical protein K452DRAFT_312172 [Aplosporella prunicola CBS 121167]